MSNSTPTRGNPAVQPTINGLSEEAIEEELEERPDGTGSLILDLLRKLRREVREVKDGVGNASRKIDEVERKVDDVEKKVQLLTSAYREHTTQLGALTSTCMARAKNCPAIGTGEHCAVPDTEPTPA